MKTSAVVALLLANAQAVNLKQSWAIGVDGDDFLGEEITMNGEQFKYLQKDTQHVQLNSPEDYRKLPREAVPKKQWTKDNMGKPEERVELKDPIINREHTTFYAQSPEDYRKLPREAVPKK